MSASNAIEVRLTGVRYAADKINIYEFRRIDNRLLPAATPGAHIDVYLPGGLIRQYSLAMIDTFLSRYVIGVKHDVNSRGGSRFMHEELRVGAILKVSPPRNNFPVVESSAPSVFIAGGIGITPILSMVRHLHEKGQPWKLYYACRTRSQAAFVEELGALGSFEFHADDEQGGTLPIDKIISGTVTDAHLYFCGPEPMRQAFERAVAARQRSLVHVELFGNVASVKVQSDSYVIELCRSNKTLVVPAAETILNVLRSAGIAVSSSCEQGVCGSCETVVLGGIPDHRDSVLTEQERASGNIMMICCSGSKSDKLILDL